MASKPLIIRAVQNETADLGHELRLLQRLGLDRQCREAAADAPLPLPGARRQGIDREAAQIAQGESNQTTRSQCRR